MASFTKFFILAAAAAALSVSAAPIDDTSAYTCEADLDAQQSGAQCGNGQKLSCCNSGSSLLGLNCLSVPIREFLPWTSYKRVDAIRLLTYRDSRCATPEVLWLQCCCLLSDW
jgi:hypothetical protein